MPFKSKSQAKWMFANKPKMAKEWASKTKSIKALPNKVTSKTPSGPKTKHFKLATGTFKEPKVIRKDLKGIVKKIK